MDTDEFIKTRLINEITVQDELRKREGYTDPSSFGLPDLLFPMNTYPAKLERLPDGFYKKKERKLLAKPETPLEYRARRYEYLKNFLEKSLQIQKDGRIEKLKIIKPVIEFIGDIFFGYIRRAILWKNRGGGGSLAAAIVMWLRMVWHNQSWMDMAGCLIPSTEVYIKELKNYIPVKCVQVGMHVWTLTEGWRPITRVIKRYGDYIAYQITPFNSMINTFTEDHLIAVVSCLERDFQGNIINVDIKKWDNLEIIWKEAQYINPEIDMVIIGKPEQFFSEVPLQNINIGKNGKWYGKERAYVSIEKFEHYDYFGEVYDLTIKSEPYFLCRDMTVHNSQDQAKQVYEYTTQFWDCFPLMKKTLLPRDTQVSLTKLITGVTLRCVTSTEKSARSKHPPGLCMDEVCQDKEGIDVVFRSAMGASLTEPNSTIIALSTFHIPVGLFQEMWDHATKLGFRRYTWSTWDIMEKCNEGMEHATDKDPNAYSFCIKHCPLTEQINEVVNSPDGKITRRKYIGCFGQARHTEGFRKRAVVIAAKAASGKDFVVEWENNRPTVPGSVYDINDVNYAEKSEFVLPENSSPLLVTVGIDWGFNEGCMCIILLYEEGIFIPDAEFMNFKTVLECINILEKWQEEYAQYDESTDSFLNFSIYADSSHPFNNNDLDEAGFETIPVDFKMVKEFGIFNITKYFENGRISINGELYKFLRQIKEYRYNKKTGKPLKRNDHAPDAMLAGMIELDYDDIFGQNSNIKYLKDNSLKNEPTEENKVLIF
ncbi:MAG: hypothetical protein KKC80_08790 [Candidatus Margulisbacteria bacterium]|nr:hypothetical protein [Candidatus Margulisiibacteriota bacterium]